MSNKHLAKTITNQELATLLQRVKDQDLATLKKVKIPASTLDQTKRKGSNITTFLNDPTNGYPAKTDDDRVKRIQFILDTLTKKGVDLTKELEDIRAHLAKSTDTPQTEKKGSEDVPNMPQSTITINKPVESVPNNQATTDITVSRIENTTNHTIDIPSSRIENTTNHTIDMPSSVAKITINHTNIANDMIGNTTNHTTLQAEIDRLTKQNQDLMQENKALREQQAIIRQEFACTLEEMQIKYQTQLDQLRKQSAPKIKEQPTVICGLQIGQIKTKYSMPWVAYAPKGKKKKIYLGTTYDVPTFERIIQKELAKDKQPTPQPTQPNLANSASLFEVNPCITPTIPAAPTTQNNDQHTSQESPQNH